MYFLEISGNPLETETFLTKQPVSLPHLGRRGPINNTIQPGNSGVAGVHRGKLILKLLISFQTASPMEKVTVYY